jgi:hypothetical protein
MFIGVRQRPEAVGNAIWDHTAAIDMWSAIRSSSRILVANNVAQGINGVGYIFPGSVCGTESGFLNNSAGTTIVGWLVSTNGSSCLNFSHFTAYKSEVGLIQYLTIPSVRASQLILAENRENLQVLHGNEADDNRIGRSDKFFF